MDIKRSIIVNLLLLASIGLLFATYHSPLWWVSLTAPNYPEEAFPDGVRIQFHMNGVFNGCKKVEKDEILEDEALDCVHEMDTINHYVGMYPIAAGGVLERAFSPFLISMLGVMLLGFMVNRPAVRMAVLGAGFAVIFGWMTLTYYGDDGLHYQNKGFISALVTAIDQDTSKEEVDLSPGEALIARLKASMEEGEAAVQEPAEESDKAGNIEHLRATFQKDQERKDPAERREWDGSGAQMLAWHYEKTLGRYFNVPEEINPMVAKMTLAANVMFWGVLAAMGLLLFGARKTGGLLYWLLILPVVFLPLLFLIDYSAWLWWYGHRLNAMGAFTVKPFMPTVFGDGKVAQFTTHSYPSIGFGLMLLVSLLTGLAALIRRKQLADHARVA
ncbi:MAG: hypothetical protein U9P11_01800 [Pseudomonadota bacterium]|nr:hypothetical protein [Pseudomonadota bacterium]